MMNHFTRCCVSLLLFLLLSACLDLVDSDNKKSTQSQTGTKNQNKKSGSQTDVKPETDADSEEEEKERQEWLRKILPKEVIVIGGGISGLAAARRITRNKSNFTVKVFEGQKDRYGGRVWTDKLTNPKARGFEVDLGGTAFNILSKNNPLIELAEDFELKMDSIDNLQFIVPWENKAYSGEQLTDITKEAAMILSRALNESNSWREEVSVTKAVDKIIENGDIASSGSPGAEFVKCFPSYILGDYSTRNYKAAILDIGYEKVLLDGMGELIDRLVSGSPDEPPLHVALNKAVRQIKINDDKRKVIIRTTDGFQAEADIVVVAVPSAVIAAGDIIFDPPLPKSHQVAFGELSTALSNKVAVEFEHAFWPSDHGVFVRAVSSNEERGHLQTWINVDKILSKPVLQSFLTGRRAADFEKLSDEEAQQSVLAVLTDMFGSEKVASGGKIVKLQRSKWIGSHWSRGSSTYPKVGTSPQLWDTFSEPLCPYVYFVGEHTAFEAHGTLHGAYNSGIRAGDQILSFHCDRKQEEEERLRREEQERKKKKAKQEDQTDDRKKAGKLDDRDEL